MIQSPMTPIKRIKSQNWQVPYSNNQEKFKADWIWNHYITITPHLKCMDMDSWMVSTFYTSNDLLQSITAKPTTLKTDPHFLLVK